MYLLKWFIQKEEREAAPQEPGSIEDDSKAKPTEGVVIELVKPKLCCSARLMIVVVCFFSFFNLSLSRVNISMQILCMEIDKGEELFPAATEGYIISGAFYGFLVGPFVAGFLSFKIGGKLTLVIGSMGCGVTHFMIPLGAEESVSFFALRVILGFFAGFTFPSVYGLFSHWTVPEERHCLVAGALVGMNAATIGNFPFSSFVCSTLSWVWLFYILAIWMTFFGSVCIFLVFDHPEDSPMISRQELQYLQFHIPRIVKRKIPWKDIAKSLPIHAFVVMHFSVNYVYLTLVFSLPLVMTSVYNFPLRENGLLSSTPFVGSFIMRVLMTLCFEQIRKKLKITKNRLRKAFVITGSSLCSFSFLLIVFVSNYRYWVLVCFVSAVSSLELCLTGGYLLSLLDLCPTYANVLTGVTNAIANIAGLICPVVNGVLTDGTMQGWHYVFYVNICILLAAMTFYVIFGKNDLQKWAKVSEEDIIFEEM